jgi:hypothetical protein
MGDNHAASMRHHQKNKNINFQDSRGKTNYLLLTKMLNIPKNNSNKIPTNDNVDHCIRVSKS